MKLYIQNDGEMEIGALTLMGATSKEGDSSKIGFFGSGNKYAMAALIREGVAFQIFSGENEILVTTRATMLRGQEYDQIYINGEPTSITTRMGPQWELWFALREFVCNAFDEGGAVITTDELAPTNGKTLIEIDYTPQVALFYQKRRNYMLEEGEPILYSSPTPSFGTVKAVALGDYPNIYRKGISVRDHFHGVNKLLYSYDIETIDINESRTIRYDFQMKAAIGDFWLSCNDEAMIRALLALELESTFEHDCFDYVSTFPSQAWYSILKDKVLAGKSRKAGVPSSDRWTTVFLADKLVDILHEAFPDISVYGESDESGWVENTNPPDRVVDTVRGAVDELSKLGITCDVPVQYGSFKHSFTIATYSSEDKTIRLAISHINDVRDVQKTLVEELMHHAGYGDQSREYGSRLIELLLNSLESYKALARGNRIEVSL